MDEKNITPLSSMPSSSTAPRTSPASATCCSPQDASKKFPMGPILGGVVAVAILAALYFVAMQFTSVPQEPEVLLQQTSQTDMTQQSNTVSAGADTVADIEADIKRTNSELNTMDAEINQALNSIDAELNASTQ